MDGDALRAMLPWDHPFRAIDAVVTHVPHRTITTRKLVSAGEARSGAGTGHGQAEWGARSGGADVLPAAMILEGMSQSAAVLFQLSYGLLAPGRVPMLGFLECQVHASAHAGDAVSYLVSAVKMTPDMGLFEAKADVDGALIAEARIAMSVSGLAGTEAEP